MLSEKSSIVSFENGKKQLCLWSYHHGKTTAGVHAVHLINEIYLNR